ncbi:MULTISPECIES: hypothetical protein [Butyricimonas]|jgi:hypothetical protein|uniref:DUF4906 domain-containing protein n=1 Tax=Butyricimonas virosa TaxID=544645 RepID=A0A415QDH4_9BACT|nr:MULTISPECIES: hypothetical protein [Butyricimonas]MBO4959020.1 hypothetical protein [Butyricimonas sp.]MBQ6793607.1 hypothetical protein [Butyricimonas sp.]MCI7294941.1 hypothetical protein [Butyricimonas virosa]MDY5011603.1 hypothetical protein [Butyricimonas virosa]MDY5489610.1 hypothetical protein [Butyricimonas virosa]
MGDIKIHIIYLLVLLTFFSACSIKEEVPGEPVTIGETKVRFELFTKAGTYGLPVSRAGENESVVDQQPWVLVFLGTGGTASFVEAVQAELYNGKTYVYLEEQAGNCQLLILANSPSRFYMNGVGYAYTADNFVNTLRGRDLDYACRNLLTEALIDPQYTVPYIGQKLPMSDLVNLSKIDASVTIPNIQLKRIVGKIVVENTDADFVLEGITVVTNVAKNSKLHNLTDALEQNIGADNLVEYRKDDSYALNIVDAEEIVTGGQTTKNNPLYVYETHSLSNDTYLVIRGHYKGESFFYKMALVNNDQHVLDILRNTEYIFTITSVRGRGFISMADAKASLASNTNLDYSILVQEESSYEIVSNNEYYLGVTNSHFEIYASAASGTAYVAFSLITDCKSESIGERTITATSGLRIVSPVDGMIPVSTTLPSQVKIEMLAGFTSGEIELRLGNLRKTVTVKRREQVTSSGTIISSFIDDGYYISAYVEDYVNHSWLKLGPEEGEVRNDPDYIYVDNGKIKLYVEKNTSGNREGVVYVSVGKGITQRIKVYITQGIPSS